MIRAAEIALAAAVMLFAGAPGAMGQTVAPYLVGQKLMVDENGNILPKGSALGVKDVAEIAASNAVTEAAVGIVREVQEATEREVGLVVETLTGVNAFAYVTDFVESLGGVAAADTNNTCMIAKFDVGKRKETIDGVSYSAQELYYYFNKPVNSTPYITFATEIGEGLTNEWAKVELGETQYLGTANIDGIEFANCYKSTVWTLTDLDRCFYRVACEVSAAQGDGSVFDIAGGIRVNGEAGETQTFTVRGADGKDYEQVFEGGLLKAIRLAPEPEPETPPEEGGAE